MVDSSLINTVSKTQSKSGNYNGQTVVEFQVFENYVCMSFEGKYIGFEMMDMLNDPTNNMGVLLACAPERAVIESTSVPRVSSS